MARIFTRKVTILISTILTILIGLSIYILFIFREKTPPDQGYGLGQGKPNQLGIKEEKHINSLNEQVLARDTKAYIRDVPLPLDPKTDQGLRDFRAKAKDLLDSYPKSFFVSIPTDEKIVALTFDDGPGKGSTEKILEILNENKVPASFFYIGKQIESYKQIVMTTIKGEHMLANHSWSHQRPTSLDIEGFKHELYACQQALAPYGEIGKIYRPPYGLVTAQQMDLLEQAGYRAVAWSVDSMDWYFDEADKIIECVCQSVHPGAIILMHSSGGPNGRQATVKALPEIIARLKEAGYSFVTIKGLFDYN